MKVLMAGNNHFFKGGATRAYFDTIEVLEKHGHQVAHFSTLTKENIPSKWERFFVKYYDLSNSSKYSFAKKIHIVFRVWYNFETRRKLRALLKEFSPEVAHLHNIYHHLSPSVIDELKKHKIPVVQTLHDFKIVCPNYDLFHNGKTYNRCQKGKFYECVLDKCVKNSYWKSLVCMIEAYLHKAMGVYQKVDVFTAPSKFYLQKAKEFGFEREIKFLPNPLLNISFVNDGFGEKQVEPKEKRGYFIFYGQLGQEKGIADLVSAFARANVKERLVILGDGPEKENLQELCKKEKISQKVEFVAFADKTNEEIVTWQKKAVALVSPSLCYENAPYSIVEAMGLGVPVICSDKGGANELVGGGKRGFVFTQGDVDDLVETLKEVSENQVERELRLVKAKKYVEKKFNVEEFYKSLIEVYQKAQNKNEKKNGISRIDS